MMAPNSTEERVALKPCPFCGSETAFLERADYSSCYVICNDCIARGPVSCNENDEDCAAEEAGMEPGENAARRLWNTRTDNDVSGLVQALERELERQRLAYEDTPKAQAHFRRNHADSLAALAKHRQSNGGAALLRGHDQQRG